MYGIWNHIEKRFVFGIKEETKTKARNKFKSLVPREVYSKYRYETRIIPPDFVNPKNKINY